MVEFHLNEDFLQILLQADSLSEQIRLVLINLAIVSLIFQVVFLLVYVLCCLMKLIFHFIYCEEFLKAEKNLDKFIFVMDSGISKFYQIQLFLVFASIVFLILSKI